MTQHSSRRYQLDLIRSMAIFGVIAIHTDNITSSPTNYLGGVSWWLVNTIHSVAVVSVPLFVMLSGALQLHKPSISWWFVVQKTSRQFVWPLLCWWLVLSWWQLQQQQQPWTAAAVVWPFFWAEIGHLYFLQVISGVYLVLPWWHQKLQHGSRRLKQALVALLLLASIGYQHWQFFFLREEHTTTFLTIWWPYISYAVLGYVLLPIKLKSWQWWLLGLVVATVTLGLSGATYLNTVALNQGVTWGWSLKGGNFWWEPFTLPVMLLSTSVFVLINSIESVLPQLRQYLRLQRLLSHLAKASFGIYVSHILVQQWLDHQLHWSIQFISYSLIWYYLQRLTATLLLSWLLVVIVFKIQGFFKPTQNQNHSTL